VNTLCTEVLPAVPPPMRRSGTSASAPRPIVRRRILVTALAASLAVHLALSLWPVDIESVRQMPPLSVTLKEMPAPPKPKPVVAPPQRKAKRVAPKAVAPPPPLATPEPAPIVAEEPPPAPPAPIAAAEVVAPPPDLTIPEPPVRLPPRLDLAYTVFLGTQGFVIGEATYRFEHSGNQYRILTVGRATGLAALLIRGEGKVESRGIITPTGLQPQEFAIERGSAERHEVARFDWELGIVILHNNQTAALEMPTYDPLAFMWQAYFAPPVSDVQSFNIATTRRVRPYTITREGTEKITWAQGEIETEIWHRRSDDGRTDGYAWLAPSLHYVPVKVRIVATHRGTLEALLDSIRVDEPLAQQ
jgi:hypothetical protein